MTDHQGKLDGNDGPAIFNVGFRLGGWELAGWELVKAVHSEPAETIYLWQQGAALARLVVAELPSRSTANERLGAELAHSMRPDIPSGRDSFPELGDTIYWCPDGDGVPGMVAFVRGNYFAGVFRGTDVPFDAAALAKEIDRLLLEPPTGEVQDVPVSTGEPTVVARGLGAVEQERLQFTAAGGDFARDGDTVIFYPDGNVGPQVQIRYGA